MNGLLALWLPILVAAVAVFAASSLVHMAFKWHNADYRSLANEDEVMSALRAGSPTPGHYVVPHCNDMKRMQEEAMLAKYRAGPVGFLTVIKSGPPAMGASLLRWFALNVVVAVVAAAVGLHALGADADGHSIAHLAGIITFLTYSGGSIQDGIWMGKPWGSVAKYQLDALIYATVSALAFMWLWP